MTIFAKGLSFGLAVSLVFAPFSTSAWFFRPANAQGNEAPPSITNVQTMGLMEPRVAMASDRRAVNDDATVTIVDGEALAATIGASGTLADVVDDGAGDITVYVVKSGDTVAGIAKLFNITANTVLWTNGLKTGAALHVGDTLLIMSENGIKYTVAKGDTLAGIEKLFQLTPDEIDGLLQYNDLGAGSPLALGQTLYIPGAELNTTVATSKSGSTKTSKSASPANVTRGYFIRPLPSSCRMSQGKHDTYAVDIACASGTPIKAAASGVVEFASDGWNGAFGGLIIIKHPNGMKTYYAHNKVGGITVSKGQSVTQGQVIGHVGSTGRSTGPHLHFEVRGGTNPGFDRSGKSWKQ